MAQSVILPVPALGLLCLRGAGSAAGCGHKAAAGAWSREAAGALSFER